MLLPRYILLSRKQRMYNKLFAKILDSSIWLEDHATVRVWLTFLASMDEDGFSPFASIGNLAGRARVTMEEARKAVQCFEAVDPESSDPDNGGRRLERVPGGWIVLNASKYREQVTRDNIREKTRQRVAAFRDRKKKESEQPSLPTMECNGGVTPSVAVAVSESVSESVKLNTPPLAVISLLHGKKHEVTQEEVAIWKDAYPAVNILGELRQMISWLDANPNKRSVNVKGSKQRINNWLKNTQNGGGSRGQNQQNSSRGGNRSGGGNRSSEAVEQLRRSGVEVPDGLFEGADPEVLASKERRDGRPTPGVVLEGAR